MRVRTLPILAAFAVALTPLAAGLEASYDPPEDPPDSEEVWRGGPVTAIEFARDGTLLFAHIEGPVYRLDPGAEDAVPVFEPPVVEGPEWGLVGLALAPDFLETGDFFAAYTTGPEGVDPTQSDVKGEMRVVRVHDGEETLIYSYTATRYHNSGRLMVHDNLLWLAQGEHDQRRLAQDKGAENGKILRMTLDGEPAPGNPHETDPEWNPYAYSRGHRNPFGMDWDDTRDILVVSTPGQEDMDEVTAIEKGGNAGWPGCDGPCPEPREGMTDPLVWYPQVVTPVGLVALNGDYFIGTMNHGEVRRIFETPEGWKDEIVFVHDAGLLDVEATPDGKWLYYGAFNGLYRIPLPESYWVDQEPTGSGNPEDPGAGENVTGEFEAPEGDERTPGPGAALTLVALGALAARTRRRG